MTDSERIDKLERAFSALIAMIGPFREAAACAYCAKDIDKQKPYWRTPLSSIQNGLCFVACDECEAKFGKGVWARIDTDLFTIDTL